MENTEKTKYFEAKDNDGNAVLCPIDEVDKKKMSGDEIEDDNCFEKDVMGRYAANIEIEQ